MLIKRQRVLFLSRRLVLVFFFMQFGEMASVFMCKTSSANHTVVLYRIVCFSSELLPISKRCGEGASWWSGGFEAHTV